MALLSTNGNLLILLTRKNNHRLNEGCGKSIYAIGFLDSGKAEKKFYSNHDNIHK